MQNHKITAAQLSASSYWDGSVTPDDGRLNYKGNNVAWAARTNDLYQWLQIDLRVKTNVTFVATQGRNGYSQRVTKYRLQYSNNGNSFQGYKQNGESSDKVRNVLTT